MKLPKGGAGSDFFLFVFFLIALGVVWVLTGGPERPISQSDPFFTSPLSGNSGFNLPSVPGVGTTTTPNENRSSFIQSMNQRFINLQEGEERSPYAEHVSLSLSTARESNPTEEYLTIKTARGLNGTVTISDWRLESRKEGVSVPLGFASGLPSFGQLNQTTPVAIGANTTVYITSGRSPTGVSFRVNRCSGYLAQFQTFEPRLSYECPFPIESLQKRAQLQNYSPVPSCYAALNNINQCEIQQGSLPPNIDPMCANIIANDLSYNGCVSLYQNDTGFYKNEWRLFLNQNEELWNNDTDRIRLVDEMGRVIDVVSY